jgi:hypothetical protein
MTRIDVHDLTSRYVAVWNEPDAALRRKSIRELWTEDGTHVLQPPAELRLAAAGLGFTSAGLEARGHDELEIRVARAYQDFVAPGEFIFRPRENAGGLRNVVKFNWEMAPAGGGAAAAVGLEILILSPDGRIEADYQFIEA